MVLFLCGLQSLLMIDVTLIALPPWILNVMVLCIFSWNKTFFFVVK